MGCCSSRARSASSDAICRSDGDAAGDGDDEHEGAQDSDICGSQDDEDSSNTFDLREESEDEDFDDENWQPEWGPCPF